MGKETIPSHQKHLEYITENNQSTVIINEYLKLFLENLKLSSDHYESNYITRCSSISLVTSSSEYLSAKFSHSINCIARPRSSCYSNGRSENNMFNQRETAVYMTFLNGCKLIRTFGTQATATVNKCLQVCCEESQSVSSRFPVKSDFYSSTTMSTQLRPDSKRSDTLHNSEVYFFGRKKEAHKPGMGSSDSKTTLRRSGQVTAAPVKSEKTKSNMRGAASVQAQSQSNSIAAQTKKAYGSSAGTSTAKAVSIKDDKPICPSASTKGDGMVATVSHIRIGPREVCPVHGKESCQGPKCIVASSAEEQPAPVKVSTVTNPRRGVFELVVRRMTGAPLAKNELMLEWTPPPSRPPPCGAACPVPCSPTTPCRPPKCKMIVCRPSPCKPKCCKKGCKKPCGPMPCRSVPCKKSCRSSCCGKPCRPCKPCPPIPKCRPCPSPPCCKSPCGVPCRSSPCLRPCPVSRKKTRRARSQPRMKAHKKRISPCSNRSKTCPVVRCRSVPGPCIACCGLPPSCPPRKCCSVYPCKPPRCCKSNCSSCCT